MIIERKIWFMLVMFGFLLIACTSQDALNEDLVQAAKKGDDQKVITFLKKGAEIEATDQKYGATSLMWAAHEGHTDVMQILLNKGVRINSQQQDGCTALWYSAQQGKLETARILIAHGADISIASHDGKTPLDIATELGYLEIAEMITNSGTK